LNHVDRSCRTLRVDVCRFRQQVSFTYYWGE
jgi:hypothetical protein